MSRGVPLARSRQNARAPAESDTLTEDSPAARRPSLSEARLATSAHATQEAASDGHDTYSAAASVFDGSTLRLLPMPADGTNCLRCVCGCGVGPEVPAALRRSRRSHKRNCLSTRRKRRADGGRPGCLAVAPLGGEACHFRRTPEQEAAPDVDDFFSRSLGFRPCASRSLLAPFLPRASRQCLPMAEVACAAASVAADGRFCGGSVGSDVPVALRRSRRSHKWTCLSGEELVPC